MSSDYGLAFDPNFSGAAVTITPTLAFGMNEEAPPNGLRRLGTLALEGVPGVVQMASEDLIVAPASPAQETEFAIRAKASFVSDDAAWKGPNGQAVWKRYHLTDSPANQSEREERIKYLPQMLGLVGTVGKLHGSNARVLGLFATGLELWLDGFNCAVNPRMIPNGDFSTPESSHFVGFGGGAALLPDNFDSMRTPYNHFNDPLQNLRDLWAESAMQDHDAETINVAFIDSAFAPNPDFRGYPDGIPQFNMQTGARGPHVAEFPETAAAGSRDHVWHGNGTVAVAGGVMGNRYGLAGVAGQVMQPMLYYMGTAEFVFESGQAMELAVADGADVINMSAGYPCRILTVLGPIRLCSVEDRAALTSTVAGLR